MICPRMRVPSSIPPEINHVVITGTLSADPQKVLSPTGCPVRLLQIEFPVVDPGDSRMLWKWGSCLVEIPEDRWGRDVEGLYGGASVLVSGQLSDRWMMEDGHTSRRGVVVASLLKSGPTPEQAGDLTIIGGKR